MSPSIRPGTVFGSAPRAARFRSAIGRAGLVRAALLLTALVAGARAVALFAAALLIDRPGDLARDVLIDVLGIVDALTLAALIVAALTWLLWVAWTSRLEENASALGSGDGSVGPRGAILWWVVPGANLLVPFGQLLGLDRRLSNAERPSHDLLIATWWIAFLAVAAVLVATTANVLPTDAAAGKHLTRAFVEAGLASLAWLVVALLAIRVVREVQMDEDRRGIAVRDNWRPGAPSRAGASQPSYPSMPARRAIQRRPLRTVVPLIAVAVIAAAGWAVYAAMRADSDGDSPLPTTRPSLFVTATPRPSPVRRTPAPGSTPAPQVTPVVEPPAPTASVDPVAAGNRFLLAHATAGDGECVAIEAPERPQDVVAAIDCTPANEAVDSLRYLLYENAEAAEAAYQLEVERSSVQPDTGTCFDGAPGESSFATNRSDRGRVVCWIDGADDGTTPTFAWFDRTLSILGEATGAGTDLSLLSVWWVKESGPA